MSIRSSFRRWLPALAAAALAFLASCAGTDYHFSQLDGHRYFRTPIDTYAVSILRVDGRDTPIRPVLVDPGLRKVIVQGPSAPASPQGEERSIDLLVRPCTRYYLVAVRPSSITADFSVKVDYEEPISGCSAPPAT